MKKKGFTLVELLAVVAVLALLIIIALPNVMQLFKGAKKDTFENELKNLYKTAQTQWVTESNFKEKVYAKNSDQACVNSLNLSGRDNIEYYIKINKKGKIVEFAASDGSYQYSYTGEGLSVEDLKNSLEVANTNENTLLAVSCTGYTGGSSSGNGGNGGNGGIDEPIEVEFENQQQQGTLTPADELIIASENFYVVSSNSNQTVLLAKYSLNCSSITQTNSTNPSTEEFATSGYWDGCNSNGNGCVGNNTPGIITGYNGSYCTTASGSNCVYVYGSNDASFEHVNPDLFECVNAYASKMSTLTGASMNGRLMSLEEAYSLATSSQWGEDAVRNNNYNTTWNGNTSYWLGSAKNESEIWTVDNTNYYSFNGLIFDMAANVRPVLTIRTSALIINN